MRITNLKEAEAALAAYAPPAASIKREDISLERMRPFMPLIGNPQDGLKVIHVAGTSGKTSTAYYIAALLAATGKKTGLAVSPHIDTILERIQINGQNISEADFCGELSVFLDLVKAANPRPSYFELFHVFTLWVMKRQKVDYVVVETGVGGLHDATNITNRSDKVCVITDIGFDHTELLGNTLAEITTQKAGIIHEHNHVFMYDQADEIMAVVKQWVSEHRARLHILKDKVKSQTKDKNLLATIPEYQQRNWSLAHYVYKYLVERDNLPHLTRQALWQTQLIQVPGRMDSRQVNGKTLIMDGAHNAQKMTAFINSFRQLYPGTKPAVLMGLKEDKEYQELIPMLTALASRVITTTFKTSQDLPVISMDSDVLARAFRAEGFTNVESIPDHQAALRALLKSPDKVCVITGSFYLLGQIRNNNT